MGGTTPTDGLLGKEQSFCNRQMLREIGRRMGAKKGKGSKTSGYNSPRWLQGTSFLHCGADRVLFLYDSIAVNDDHGCNIMAIMEVFFFCSSLQRLFSGIELRVGSVETRLESRVLADRF